MPHHGVLVAMVVFGMEEGNGKGCHGNADYCTYDKVEDGHATLHGKRYGELDPPVFPKLLSYKNDSLLSVIQGLPMMGSI